MSSKFVLAAVVAFSLLSKIASAQTAAPASKPDDTPSIKVGGVLFSDYTYTKSPKATDSDGNSYHPSAFGVSRAYLNFTGNVSHLVAFRVTPDVTRETGSGSSLNGSMVFRIKYAFAQINTSKNTWVRLGIQQTPWVDFEEGINRYRFEGTMFSERDGYLSSSDAGASLHYNVSKWGEVHAGIYNGENYNRAEANDQKAFQVRASVKPFAGGRKALQGLRVHVFYDGDNYVRNAERRRTLVSATYEQKLVNTGVEYLNTKDQLSVRQGRTEGKGYSFWATPKLPKGWEVLLRHDHLTPNDMFGSQVRNRNILGTSYWFPHKGSVSTSLMLDYDSTTNNFGLPKQQRIALHGLVSF